MIQPQDLMALAHRLSATAREPEGRAAISRAYYSAFHVARLLITDGCGVVLPSGPDVHRKLLFCLDETKNVQLAEIGDQLNSLREERNRADYDLKDSRFANPGNVQRQLAIAEQIVLSLQAANANLDTFRPIVREYAQAVLRLSVRG